jgi:hypothetical protein
MCRLWFRIVRLVERKQRTPASERQAVHVGNHGANTRRVGRFGGRTTFRLVADQSNFAVLRTAIILLRMNSDMAAWISPVWTRPHV